MYWMGFGRSDTSMKTEANEATLALNCSFAVARDSIYR